MAVMIDDDLFIDMCMTRVDDFPPAEAYPESFWKAALERLRETGWLDENKNTPSYIVDNIAVNGEIKTLEEIRDNYTILGMDQMSDEELEEHLIETEWEKVDNYFVRRWGL
jgi:hypothetical protein